jgi:hypothetical protein
LRVPDIAEEVAGFGLGAEEVLVIVVGKLEVSIDVPALKPEDLQQVSIATLIIALGLLVCDPVVAEARSRRGRE